MPSNLLYIHNIMTSIICQLRIWFTLNGGLFTNWHQAAIRTVSALPAAYPRRFLGKYRRAIMTCAIMIKAVTLKGQVGAACGERPGSENMKHSSPLSHGFSGDHMQNRSGPQKAQDPSLCPCKKKSCPRYRNCDTCRAHHAAADGPPYCERRHNRPGK